MKQLVRWACLLLVFSSSICAEEKCQTVQKEKTICLNMIVKNERDVIQRCLASVKDIIDYWVIVDTGSTDGTQQVIKECLKEIPGKLYERPWVDFAHNRNEALELAKGKADYLFFIDADEELVFSEPFIKSNLSKDFYLIRVRTENVDCTRTLIINDAIPGWKWVGVLHEYVENPKAKSYELLEGVRDLAITSDGFRSKDPLKYLKDAQVLEKALEKDPTNSRYVFYLAQSYLNAKEQELALKNFEKRVSMKKEKVDTAEIYWSLLMIGEIHERLELPQETVISDYCKAYHFLPTQGEPLLRLASYLCSKGNYILGYATAKTGLSIPPNKYPVFSMPWIYEYGFQSVIAECCFRMEKYQEAYDALKETVKNQLPPEVRTQILSNLEVIKLQIDKSANSILQLPKYQCRK